METPQAGNGLRQYSIESMNAKQFAKEWKALKLELWEEREHKSELSGKPVAFIHHTFAHILPRNFKRYRLIKENIMFLTIEEHVAVDHQAKQDRPDPMYQKFFDKQEELMIRYNAELKQSLGHR